MNKPIDKIKKGDYVEFRPIVTGRVYHKRNSVLYIEFNGGKGYQSPPYKVKKL
jgi:hypothetical protein